MDLHSIHTILVVPGHRPEWEPAARASGADLIQWDLEDSVPFDAKAQALTNIERAIKPGDCVRLNALGTRWHRHEVDRLAGKVDLAFYPKYEGNDWGGERPPWGVVPIIETPRGVTSVGDIAGDVGVVGLAFGQGDLAASIGFYGDQKARMIEHARMVVSWAALGEEIPCWHGPSVTLGFHMVQAAFNHAQMANDLRYTGVICVHPSQVSVSQEPWIPTPQALELATEITELGQLGGPVTYRETLLSPAAVRVAQRLLSLWGEGPSPDPFTPLGTPATALKPQAAVPLTPSQPSEPTDPPSGSPK